MPMLPASPCPGRSDWHAFCAAKNCGELGSMLVIFSCTPPPLNVGSGKFGTPFERMQAENFKACACCAALTVPPCPPPGCSDWQAFCAACICGELGSRSEPALALICSELP